MRFDKGLRFARCLALGLDLVRELIQSDQGRAGRVFEFTRQDPADRRLADASSLSDHCLGAACRDKELGGLLSCTKGHGREEVG